MPSVIIVIALILIACALTTVNAINKIQEKDRIRRQQQRKLKLQADFLLDIVKCLEQTTPNRLIAKLINDEVIKLFQSMAELEKTPNPVIDSSIEQAEAHSEQLMSNHNDQAVSYQRPSDEKITETQAQITEAIKQVRHLCFQNIISETDLSAFETELSWSYLMVGVASIIGKAQRLRASGDKPVSRSLFEKAQKLLAESLHPDPRRLEMLAELKELIEGSRETMSNKLLPD